MSGTGWSEERIALLRRHFDEGHSASMMSKELGISRGAVIGKLHRLGLRREKTAPRQREEIAAARERRRVLHNIAQNKRRNAVHGLDEESLLPRRAAPSIAEPAVADYAPLGIPFADLDLFSKKNPNQCRFMAAEHPAPEYRACGAETAPGESWCPHCREIVMAKPGPVLSAAERFRRSVAFRKNALPRSVTNSAARDQAA